jgi:putative flippase GtrA
MLLKRREVVKFLLVGGTCYLITMVINYILKFTILTGKPVTALTIANVVAAAVSYVLNREWSFRTRGGRRRHHEASLFFLFSAFAVGLSSLPMYASRYVFQLQVPTVSRPTQEVADFVSGLIIGTLLGLVFRLWSFRRWVFPEENARPGRGATAREPAASSLVPAAASVNGHGANGHGANGHGANGHGANGLAQPVEPVSDGTR